MTDPTPPEILLVEDDPNDLELALRALDRVPGRISVQVARDGAAALDFFFGAAGRTLSSPPRHPAAVLLDIKLPAVDGIDVLRRLKSTLITRDMPVVMLSSSCEVRDIASCYDLGANSYVVKPVEARDYERAVTEICAYWIGRNQPPGLRSQ